MSDLEQLETFVNNIYDVCGKIDILINNGGISHRGSILHTKLDVDQKIMFTNYFGSVGLTKGNNLFFGCALITVLSDLSILVGHPNFHPKN